MSPKFARVRAYFRVGYWTRPRAEKPANRHTGRDSAEGLLGDGTHKKNNAFGDVCAVFFVLVYLSKHKSQIKPINAVCLKMNL